MEPAHQQCTATFMHASLQMQLCSFSKLGPVHTGPRSLPLSVCILIWCSRLTTGQQPRAGSHKGWRGDTGWRATLS
jgi:hypothetical protein